MMEVRRECRLYDDSSDSTSFFCTDESPIWDRPFQARFGAYSKTKSNPPLPASPLWPEGRPSGGVGGAAPPRKNPRVGWAGKATEWGGGATGQPYDPPPRHNTPSKGGSAARPAEAEGAGPVLPTPPAKAAMPPYAAGRRHSFPPGLCLRLLRLRLPDSFRRPSVPAAPFVPAWPVPAAATLSFARVSPDAQLRVASAPRFFVPCLPDAFVSPPTVPGQARSFVLRGRPIWPASGRACSAGKTRNTTRIDSNGLPALGACGALHGVWRGASERAIAVDTTLQGVVSSPQVPRRHPCLAIPRVFASEEIT